jgi:hypothetical protein
VAGVRSGLKSGTIGRTDTACGLEMDGDVPLTIYFTIYFNSEKDSRSEILGASIAEFCHHTTVIMKYSVSSEWSGLASQNKVVE